MQSEPSPSPGRAVPRRILIIAGEASGDLHGSNLVRQMKAIEPGLRFYGVGGRKMREAGVELAADIADMAVVGLTEVVKKIPAILGVRRKLKLSLGRERPALAIFIDYPDFNLPMAKLAKSRGIPVFYYISPQVWAWRKGRIGQIGRTVDRMAVILPFEEELYRASGVDVSFVGHPLLDAVKTRYGRDEALRRFGLKDGVRTIALLPGSRPAEVERMLPVMMRMAAILERELPPLQFVLPVADSLPAQTVEDILGPFGTRVALVRDDIYDAVAVADLAVVTSGTATLETALLEKPMIIVYKMSMVSYAVGRMVVKVPCIGLVNIIAGKKIVPELIQGDAGAERMAAEAMDILSSPERQAAMKRELSLLRRNMGTAGASERAARIALAAMRNFR
ncbi:MAG: Lipid-A-disaccharide synthase [Syntrophaceae bacterium PtaU1.Bin231]|nr:MAG: Lipid-A-disaccharide synthase [Syntrophaceae bacterium PtaU1.Bin231]HOG17067.1 lipid-A-disaccharide synthase [Syntrophales bacterium]